MSLRPLPVPREDGASARQAAKSCPLREALFARARAGDQHAIERLLSSYPAELPAAIKRAERDDRIRAIGRFLAATWPRTSTYRIAQIIAAAGAALDCGHRTAERHLRTLNCDEMVGIEAEIRGILEWSPVRHDGSRWPRTRQIFAILCP
jgi:hypothetical protein